MEKKATLHIRVSPQDKIEAEKVLKHLGLSTADAVNIYLRQIALTKGIPFALRYPDEELARAEIFSILEEAEASDRPVQAAEFLSRLSEQEREICARYE